MQAMIERDRRYKLGAGGPRIEIDDAYIGGERTGEGSGGCPRGHTPFIIAVETTAQWTAFIRPVCSFRGFQHGAKRSGYAPVSKPELPSSATVDSGFNALPGSRVLSTSAMSRAPAAPLPDIPWCKYGVRECSKTASLGHSLRRRGQTSPALPRRLRLAL